MCKGAGLLAVYSAGLGIPFMLAAAGVGTFLGFMKRFRKHLRTVETVMGVLLVAHRHHVPHRRACRHVSYWLIEQFPWLLNLG